MKLMAFLALVYLLCAFAQAAGQSRVVLIVHGGVGVPADLSPEMEKRCRTDLEKSLKEGYAALQSGTSLDAVEAAVKVLEDSPLFNAGKGAVFTRDGTNELDASIMEGTERKAGAVAGVSRVKNPIAAARAVMEKSEHVLLVGVGAERFAFSHGVTEVSPRYFWVEERWKDLLKAERQAAGRQGAQLPLSAHFGTVGAVALDAKGRLAAATSTGGMTYKRPGRVGDSPIIGAGTYADDRVCAISCTGHGEVFIRHAVAHDIYARVRYQGKSIAQAANEVFAEMPKEDGGVGGAIVLDKSGKAALKFDTDGMFRGTINADGQVEVKIREP